MINLNVAIPSLRKSLFFPLFLIPKDSLFFDLRFHLHRLQLCSPGLVQVSWFSHKRSELCYYSMRPKQQLALILIISLYCYPCTQSKQGSFNLMFSFVLKMYVLLRLQRYYVRGFLPKRTKTQWLVLENIATCMIRDGNLLLRLCNVPRMQQLGNLTSEQESRRICKFLFLWICIPPHLNPPIA